MIQTKFQHNLAGDVMHQYYCRVSRSQRQTWKGCLLVVSMSRTWMAAGGSTWILSPEITPFPPVADASWHRKDQDPSWAGWPCRHLEALCRWQPGPATSRCNQSTEATRSWALPQTPIGHNYADSPKQRRNTYHVTSCPHVLFIGTTKVSEQNPLRTTNYNSTCKAC